VGNDEPLTIVLSMGLFWAVLFLLVVPATIAGIAFGLRTGYGLLVRRQRNTVMTKVAAELGLSLVPSAFGALSITGVRIDLQVRIEAGRGAIRIVISGARMPRHFEIFSGEPMTVATGDPRFDYVRFPRGSEPDILSRLDAPTRAWLVENEATFVNGELVVHVAMDAAKVIETVRGGLVVAERLASTRPAEGLLQIATSDPRSAVRENAENALTMFLPRSTEAARVFRTWLADPRAGPNRHGRARLFLGEKARAEDIREIAVLLADRGAPQIMEYLLTAVPEELLGALLPAISETHAERLIDHLARAGTAASVGPIRNLSALPGTRFAAAISHALDQIRARIEGDGGGAGQLALAQTENAGALALNEERGAMSIVPVPNTTKN